MSSHSSPSPLVSRPSPSLRGRVAIPGDKSISHRALIFGLLSVGETHITRLLEGEDVLRTAAAVKALGATVNHTGEGAWTVTGVGIGGLIQPADVLDFGNAGTGSRLIMGVVGSHSITATIDGDASLRKRPMRRILAPLEAMGATVVSEEQGGRCPITLRGAQEMIPITYQTPVPSAQIKSAVLLAGLNAPGTTTVIEQEASRDHTERMLRHFGAEVEVTAAGTHGRRIALKGQPELRAAPVAVPADPSSAAFPLVAALVVPGSEVILQGVMTNPLRTGLVTTLIEMGADITLLNHRTDGGEEVADLEVRFGPLKGVDVPAERAPSMIDEYPILAVAAAFASGETRMRGLSELRVKESDRLAAVAEGLFAAGIKARIEDDDLIVEGVGGTPAGVRGGGTAATHLDHRIAMSFLVLGLGAREGMAIDDAGMIATSFPSFVPLMRRLGANLG
ncbi:MULTISPECIES: 3-phosphoshikimate 1-carboxyvinyltransferase [unclassified Chelatococcus]|uniref:3-phosphoshikimate 1-carboxyvinyltransferase n=1 Tax=unclassified Chelatococcus TaxID=2638111 RepID=UPI001BD065AE|nr:3-phosphoshikimate 1-carboxyvinyltransferase [Chelatococcus sp.]MBS7696360.1 3-phosphoshikimate 1-carboxyvinyltransferase [Chelatococcus sp. YT9]MBX3556970.1 3-phosphoshikimate 1-carboxyvinyltransferase [Chelatococcus sp.]